jgi:hypothetical protein
MGNFFFIDNQSSTDDPHREKWDFLRSGWKSMVNIAFKKRLRFAQKTPFYGLIFWFSP